MTGQADARAPLPSLSQRAFPRRVRMLLEGVLEYASDELERGLTLTLNEHEQHLFKLAEQARNNQVQSRCFEALREIRRGRADVTPRFLIGLEAALAGIKDPLRERPLAVDQPSTRGQLSLVEDEALDEDVLLNEIASRAEIRNSLSLFLLGQRFGVIGGQPAFDAEHLPVGPHALCRVLREAIGCLELDLEQREGVYRQFDRQVMQQIGPFYDAINAYLIRQKVLPNLTFVPIRARPVARDEPAAGDRRGQSPGAGGSPPIPAGQAGGAAPGVPGGRGAGDGGARGGAGGGGRAAAADASATPAATDDSRRATPRPVTGWPGVSTAQGQEAAAQDAEMFSVLRQLLAGRRSLIGKLGGARGAPARPGGVEAGGEVVQSILGQLQSRPPQPVVVDGQPQPRSVRHLKQDLLASLRQQAPDPKQAPALSGEDSDTIDLIGMLFDHIMKDVRPNTPAAQLLTKLQVPLVRVALNDKGFFTRQGHPARQMLNAIAETGAYWAGEDDADRSLIGKMEMLVDRVSREFDGDMTLFEVLLGDLSEHLRTVVRKAEVSERRHVEAARGKEKLELSRLHAAEAMDRVLAGKRVPRFLATLLGQAWTDVLALTALRQGEDSDAWQHQLHIAGRLVEAAAARRGGGAALIGPAEAQSLRAEIEQSLAQVGYHGEDAQAIANRLLAAAPEEEEDDPASRTELAMRLKSRTRLGGKAEDGGAAPSTPGGREASAPLGPEEKAQLDRIRQLPFGTWMEFTVNQQGDRVRRRLSWYSTVTGHCLFVNHRGQRVAEHTISWLARELARGNVRVVEAADGNMIDRAWSAIVSALRSFAGRPQTAA